jgi:uncharacterized protein (TIGR03000 family)
MYTLMMMTALSTSPDTAQFNGFFRDLFNRDERGSCNGKDSTSNTNSSSCHGSCHGHGLFHGGIINAFRRDSNSCHGSSCQGNTAKAASSCHGNSCHGSSARSGSGCCGGSVYAGASCFGSSCFGGSMPMTAIPYAPMGYDYAQPSTISYGSAGCLGGGMDSYPSITPPGLPMGPPMVMPPSDQAQPRAVPPSENNTYRISEGQRATVIVKLPADAQLFAEGRPLSLTSGERKFTTPPLPADREAIYSFRIEYSRDGETVSQSKKVTVKAGSVAMLEFNELTTKANTTKFSDAPAVATPTILPPLGSAGSKPVVDRAKITVKVPSGSTLYVDGKKNERSDDVREFTTPTLTAGKLYTYVMRLERGAEKEERTVEFMAGETHTVDFTGQRRASR